MREENMAANYDLVFDILLRLPLKTIIRFKSVSREWKSLIESHCFVKTHMKKSRCQFLVALDLGDGDDSPPSLFPDEEEGEEEEEICYIRNCDASRISLTCNGLICIPGLDSIEVCNPATRESRRFPNGEPLIVSTTGTRPHAAGTRPVPMRSLYHRKERYQKLARFPTTKSTFGFGQDEVTGAYKVVELRVFPNASIVEDCNVLDLETGRWRYISLVPYRIFGSERSVYVNGSVHWFTIDLWEPNAPTIVAFDLHVEEFRVVSHPNPNVSSDDSPYFPPTFSELLSLQNRLSVSEMRSDLYIWSMVDVQEQIWGKMYKICLCGIYRLRGVSRSPRSSETQLFTLVAIPKEENGVVIVWDYQETLFKTYPNGFLPHKVSACARVVTSSYFQSLVRVSKFNQI